MVDWAEWLQALFGPTEKRVVSYYLKRIDDEGETVEESGFADRVSSQGEILLVRRWPRNDENYRLYVPWSRVVEFERGRWAPVSEVKV